MSQTTQRLVLACGALVYELVEMVKQSPELEQSIKLHCLPAHLHNTPQRIAPEVDKYLSEHASAYQEVYVAYGDCGTAGALDEVLDKHQAQRLPGAHCYEFFAGSADFEQMMEQELGSFFLTDYMVKFFDRIIMEGLGIAEHPELLEMYFGNYKRLVYIAQTKNEELQSLAQAQAAQLGLEYHYRFVGKQGLNPVVEFPLKPSISIEVQHAVS